VPKLLISKKTRKREIGGASGNQYLAAGKTAPLNATVRKSIRRAWGGFSRSTRGRKRKNEAHSSVREEKGRTHRERENIKGVLND